MSTILKGKLFIISGPSGVGKGTVITALKRRFPQFVYPISHTTRRIRPGEKDGETYHFISVEEFKKGIEQGEFLEWAQVHKQDYYGTLKKTIMDALEEGKIIVREVDVQGFHSIRKVVPKENLVTIFLKAESLEKLIERIARRGKLPEEELKRRMESARVELEDAHLFDYQVWSLEDRIPRCVGDVVKIIGEESAKAGLKI
jgi:guanylate kinase